MYFCINHSVSVSIKQFWDHMFLLCFAFQYLTDSVLWGVDNTQGKTYSNTW